MLYIYKNKTLLNYLIIILMLIISFMSVITPNNFIKWIYMEIVTLMFISFMNINNYEKIPSLIYFVISSISSLILFFNLLMLLNYWYLLNLNQNFYQIFINFSLFMKIGLFPFHMWMIYSSSMLSWLQIFYLSTLTKIIPIDLMNNMLIMNYWSFIFIILNSLLSSILAFNELSIKKILAYSSMNQSSYLMIIMYNNTMILYLYLMMYIINSFIFMYLLNIFNLKNLNFLLNFFNYKKMNYLFILMIFSYSMFPPFGSFIMKWSLFSFLLSNLKMSFILFIILLISSIMMSWNYLNIAKFHLIQNKMIKKFFMIHYNMNYMLLILSFLMFNSFWFFYLMTF